jgi:hypothetical protein
VYRLRELPRDWQVESSIPAGDDFDTQTDQELFMDGGSKLIRINLNTS